MRLRSVWISQYKNLRDFSIAFEGDGFIDIFVGKNGSGKSNFLEALIAIFHHIGSSEAGAEGPDFDYALTYEIGGAPVEVAWRDRDFAVNGRRGRRTIGERTPFPDHLLVYYSGQNEKVSSLVDRYEQDFRGSLRRAKGPVPPRIIGIGPTCKKLLVVTMLLLPEENVARQILCQKLGILGCRRAIDLVISRPYFAPRDDHDPLDPQQLFWGVDGYAGAFLRNLLDSIEGDFSPGQLYDREAGVYRLTCNVDRLRASLGDDSGVTLFRSLDALRVMGMLGDVRLPFTLKELEVSGLDLFSDGQFQSVYLFAVAELFKHLNCVALLDEPDAFLHPEWQFEFLRQVNAISEEAARTNHILLTSHSASTIAGRSEGRVRLFEVGEGGVSARLSAKAELVRSLSAGLITFSEQEATLSIDQIVSNSDGPILFTEGLSDAVILRTAWDKLYPGVERPFAIEHGYGRGFLRNLFTAPHLFEAHPGRQFFALFDFDEAYQDWIQLGTTVETDPTRCLAKKKTGEDAYALLLPVPNQSAVRAQVLREDGRHFGDRSRLSIELMFCDVPELQDRYEPDPNERDACIRFLGNKVEFAQDVVPTLQPDAFGVFKPIFDFVQARAA